MGSIVAALGAAVEFAGALRPPRITAPLHSPSANTELRRMTGCVVDSRPVGGIVASCALSYTGHALVDIGLAGLCAFAGRACPEALTLEDLDRASTFLEETYYQGKLGTYLSCVF